MTRNLIDDETAERNRTEGLGSYTFNAPLARDFEGVALTVACVRIGDHAHLDIESGRAVYQPDRISPRIARGRAGRLILRWEEWLLLRETLAATDYVHVAEVERPTFGQISFHTR